MFLQIGLCCLNGGGIFYDADLLWVSDVKVAHGSCSRCRELDTFGAPLGPCKSIIWVIKHVWERVADL